MTVSVQRYFSAGVLTIWGVMLAHFCFSGRVASYLHPSFHLWTGVSGIILLLLAAGLLFLPEGHDPCCDSGCEPSNVRQMPIKSAVASVILVVPMLVAATVSPDQFGAATVTNRGYLETINDLPGYKPYVEPALPAADDSQTTGGTEPDASYLPKNETGQIKAQTVDLLYAAEEPTMREDFENKEVELIGQFMPARANNSRGDRFNLVRMFIICCAADARPVAVTVQLDKSGPIAEMSWVKVIGKATFPMESGRRIPLVLAESVTVCEPPEETFIY
jgi:uncharacterized repeat protein (TIGR03943 family)